MSTTTIRLPQELKERVARAAKRAARPTIAEADGNRTRLGARAPTSVLKTEGPTRNPDASVGEHSRA